MNRADTGAVAATLIIFNVFSLSSDLNLSNVFSLEDLLQIEQKNADNKYF